MRAPTSSANATRDAVAQQYASFLCAVKDGRDWEPPRKAEPEAAQEAAPEPEPAVPEPVAPEYIAGMGHGTRRARVRRSTQDAPRANARDYAARRARRPYPREAAHIFRSRPRCAPGSGMAPCAAVITDRQARWTTAAWFPPKARPSPAISTSSMPRRIAFPTPTITFPPFSAAS